MGIILAKLRKVKSTEEVLEALQNQIDTLEAFTVNTQQQKKRIVGNFLAISIGVYVIAFVVFYFVYFPSTWRERFIYFIPLLLFPIIIILLRYLFTWYFQRKLNKSSKKLIAAKAEKKKILEQVMDKETYKVAVNLLARFADKPTKQSLALSSTTPNKLNQSSVNRSLQSATLNTKIEPLGLTPSAGTSFNNLNPPTPRVLGQKESASPATGLLPQIRNTNQQLRRRTPFPIVNQQEKGVFDRIVDVLIGDGPQDRFAMICKECFSHNGMVLKEDFGYIPFKCAFCNAFNPAHKERPLAPRLSVRPSTPGSDSSDSASSASGSESSDGGSSEVGVEKRSEYDPQNITLDSLLFSKASKVGKQFANNEQPIRNSAAQNQSQTDELNEKSKRELKETPHDALLEQFEKSDAAIDDTASKTQ